MSKRVMIVVKVPLENADAVRDAIGKAGGGTMGEYTHCSFSYRGKGRFIPGSGANPTIGSIGKLEVVEEECIEVDCEEVIAASVVNAIRQAHIYEEPAIAVYPLLDY